MHDKFDDFFHNNKTSGLKNPETHVLTHNRFKTCIVLILSDLNKAQMYKL